MTTTTHRLYLPDVSEFQPNVDWAKVNDYNGGAAIIRACYGDSHTDKAWGAGSRRESFWHAGGRVLGIYQYLVADQDPVAQARALAALVGKLRPMEFLICDDEEGSGAQSHRYHLWANELARHGLTYPGYAGHWLYSSEYFFKEHDLLPVKQIGGRWVAAYGPDEPDFPHALWQYTSSGAVPGVPGHCDVSMFHGSLADLARKVHHGAPPVPTPHKPHKPPPIRHPFAKLRVDGDLGPITVAALNHWLGVKAHPADAICGRTIRALQHKTGADVDGEWGRNNCALHGACKSQTTAKLQRFLTARKFKAPTGGVLDGATIKALQRFLNKRVGRF